jgi:hypothetical protein
MGLVFFLGSCVCIILALVLGGSTDPWGSGQVVTLLVVGGVLLAAFILTEMAFEKHHIHRVPSFMRPVFFQGTPMIPLEIFRDWDVTICQWNNLAGGMLIYGQFYYVAIYFTVVFSYAPAYAGKQLLYFLPGLGLGAWTAIFFINRVFRGTKFLLVTGTVLMAVGTGLFSMAVENQSKGELYGFMALLGVGVGMVCVCFIRSLTIDFNADAASFTGKNDAVLGNRHCGRLLLPVSRRNRCFDYNVVSCQQ